MNKFYLILLFTGFTFFSQAQSGKISDGSPAMENNSSRLLKLYPNPATTIINFEYLKSNQRNLTLQIYNFVGKKIYETSTVSQKTTVPLNEFYRGVYIFQLRDKTGQIVESGKFQVSK